MTSRSRQRSPSIPLLRPRRLAPGDVIGIVAPASPPPDPTRLDLGIAALQRLGYRVKLAKHARARRGFLAGTDRERAGDLMRLFTDRAVDAILCVRGGYGAPRLLPLLDYREIRRHAKVFVGYRDLTALHCAFLTQAGMVSFHGPHVVGDFARADLPPFTLDSFQQTVGAGRTGDIAAGCRDGNVTILRSGRARGRLIGGNLSLLCSLIGTPWLPDFRGRILFLEDVGEQPYRFDRMLTQLRNAGLLQQVAGIAVGVNADCEDPKAKDAKEFRQTIDDVLRDRLLPLQVPVAVGLPFGHVPLNATLPVGVNATLDAGQGKLLLNEPGVEIDPGPRTVSVRSAPASRSRSG
jgi:muramoyltetrapeptide carboxypeptidase